MRQIEVGIFLPIGNNGYLMSTTSPQYMPTWQLQRDLGIAAEALGYDFLFSMSKWRGFGGATRFWDFTLESVSVMTALAASTRRLRLIATMSPPLLHPVVAAKMAATIDEISGGRFGINIVTGSSLAEYDQMGVLPPGYDDYRYAYASEWLAVIKRLWTKPAVDFDGSFFHLRDCVLAPKPIQTPRPFLVCGSSRPSARARHDRTMSSAAFGGQVISGSAQSAADHIAFLVENDGIDKILLM